MFGKELLRFVITYWYLVLILLFFLSPLLYRIKDTLSGRPKREAEARALTQWEKTLVGQKEELQRQREALSKERIIFEHQRQHINDLVRNRTIDMARKVASRDYLQTTPAFAALSFSDSEVQSSAYYSRLRSVLNTSMRIVSPFDITADIISESGNIYHTTLHSCNCPDFQFRKSPCKHMLRLAVECGLLLNGTAKDAIEKDIAELLNKRDTLLSESARISKEAEILSQEKKNFNNLLKETKQTYPWLAKMFSDLYEKYDEEIIQLLRNKSHAAHQTADRIERSLKRERSKWKAEAKQTEYQLHFYESLFPWLLTFKEVPPIEAFEYATASQAAPTEDQALLKKYLSPEEYANLSTCDKYQLALDRYIERKKSSWEVGIEYERYIGYLCEAKGYSVHYSGATEKLKDMGRDLILEKENQTVLIQCKRWAKEKTIHENHVFQLAGSTYEYQHEHPERQVIGVFVTTVDFSSVAVHCAELLGLRLFPLVSFQDYPRIKCNIGKGPSGEIQKIYHLPMDQQYDNVKIDSPGEFYAYTIEEAEAAGFRRAYRWHGKLQKIKAPPN
ncbi:restriction endonuclease [uncultured Dysosmobacter sp.]|uniref:restriction endonuclease n=1 Tax=uncultured Dysosmobacter sp. TaxID=2591384 RepID=UPI0026234A79|nr:restriction endonuclease [uncultured Dysosmobacter sp.]